MHILICICRQLVDDFISQTFWMLAEVPNGHRSFAPTRQPAIDKLGRVLCVVMTSPIGHIVKRRGWTYGRTPNGGLTARAESKHRQESRMDLWPHSQMAD